MTALETIGVACALAAYGYFAVVSVVLTIVDARTHRLPDRHVLPAYVVAALLLGAAAILTGAAERLLTVVGGALALFAFYLVLRMLRPGAMGGGDVKLAGAVGAFLGFFGWDSVLTGALAGFVLGGVYGVILLATRRAGAGAWIAFGPWMLAGAWFAIVLACARWLGG